MATRRQRAAAALSMTLIAGAASAATTIEDFFNARGLSPTRDYFNELPYEHIDPLTGNLLLTFTDLVLPGNAGLDLRIQRTYNSKIYVGYPGTTLREDSWAGVGWTLHMGRIRNPTAGVPGPIEMPDGSQHELFTNASPSGTFITRGFWIYDRNSASPVLKLTNGLVYTFARSTTINGVAYRYVTRIADPFGNHIDVTYTTGAPVDAITSIAQHLGAQVRTVTFLANGTNAGLSSMTYDAGANAYTWTYTHVAASSAGFNRLTQVQPPVGVPWKYQYDTAGAFIEELIGITTPNVGQIDYGYGDVVLNLGSTQQVTTPAVVSRTASGPNLTTGTWTYAYAQGTAKNQSVVTQPSGCVTPAAAVTTTYTFLGVGNNYSTGAAWSVGLVSSKVVKQASSTLETTSLAWKPSVALSLDQQIVGPNVDQDTFVPLLDLQTITRGGRNYITDFEYATTNFNDYARANSIVETGDLSRTTTRTFDYAFTPYIKDRIASETVTAGGNSFTESYAYDDSTGFKTSETIYGVTTTFAAYSDGNLQSATDARGKTTTYTYNWGVLRDVFTPEYAAATVSRVIKPEGTVASETRLVKTAPGSTFTSATTSFLYDGLFRLTRRTPPSGSPLDYSFDNVNGAWARVTRDADGAGGVAPSVVTSYLDGLGRVHRLENSLGIRSDTTRDACGQPTIESYPYSGAPSPIPGSTYAYDGLGRIKSKSDPGNTSGTTVVSYAYPSGVDVTTTDEASRVTEQHLGAFGDPAGVRLLSIKDADLQTTAYSYNALGNLTLVDPPGTSAQRSWAYNTKNQLISETHPESGTTTYTYYANGALNTRSDAAGLTTYTIDNNSRVTFVDRPGTGYDTTLSYDPSDTRTQATNSYVNSAFLYDTASRLTSRQDVVNGSTVTTSYLYDGNDNVKQITYPSGRQINYTHDSENRISTVTLGATNLATAFTYHPSGGIDTYVAGNGLTHDVDYNNRYRVKTVNTLNGATSNILKLDYVYSTVGNVDAITEATRSGMNQSFSYDALDRLKTADGPWGTGANRAEFQYNTIGDRTSKKAGGLTTNYAYNATTNRLTGATGVEAESVGYDSSGNITSNAAGTYTYTPERMMETATVGGATVTYRYDADSLRKLKIQGASTRYFLHDARGQVISEFEEPCGGAGLQQVRDYVFAGSRLLSSVRPSAAPGVTVALVAAAGSVGEGTGSIAVGVRVTTSGGGPTTCPVSVPYSTSNGTAAAGSDYQATTGTLTFAAGSASGSTQNVSVPILQNSAYEGIETFSLSLAAPAGAALGTPGSQVVTVGDDDPAPTLSINDVSLTEGHSGSASLVFSVTLSGATEVAASASYATANQTATAGSDYTAASGTLTFAPGMTSQTVNITVAGDTTIEPDETFTVTLSAPTNATLSRATATGTILNDDSASTGTPVVWASLVGVSANANSLTKTAATAWGNGGAVSTQTLASGDGSVEFTASETTTYRMLGLSNGDSDQNYTDIDFAIYPAIGGALYVYEKGVSKGTFGSYATGDVLRVAVEGGVVRYRRNGALLYTSTAAPAYPLLVDTALYTQGATLNAASVLGGWSTTPPAGTPVVWTSLVGVSANSNSLTKTAAAAWGNAGAVSSQSLASGNGSVEVTASETTTYRMFGLSNGDSSADYTDIDFGFYPAAGGALWVYEAGTSRGQFGTYGTNDKLQVAVESGVVKYKKNGTVVYTSTVAPTYPLLVDTALYTQGATLNNAMLGGSWATGPVPALSIADVILNDDYPSVSIADANVLNVTEGGELEFTVSVTPANTEDTSVAYATTLDAPSLADVDYVSTNGTLTFAPGVAQQTVTVPTLTRVGYQGKRIVRVQLSTPDHLTIGTDLGQGQIDDADPPPSGLVGKGDMNGNGTTDIVSRNASTGVDLTWLLNGSVVTGAPNLTPSPVTPTEWEIVGTDDFNGDGKTDILWRQRATGANIIWFMDGTARADTTLPPGYVFMPSVTPLDWKIGGTGDFDLDGKTDILWRQQVTGDNLIWFMPTCVPSATVQCVSTGYVFLPNVLPATWEVGGTADFNADGTTDIVWRDRSTTATSVWYMPACTASPAVPGCQATGVGSFPALSDPNWRIRGIGDLDLDDKPDVIWQNDVTRVVFAWYMDGVALKGWAYLSPQAYRQLAAPRLLVGPR